MVSRCWRHRPITNHTSHIYNSPALPPLLPPCACAPNAANSPTRYLSVHSSLELAANTAIGIDFVHEPTPSVPDTGPFVSED